MRAFSAKSRIALGQVCLVLSILLGAIAVGLVPNEHAAVMKGRAKLCEAIALNSSVLVSRQDTKGLEAALTAVVHRNPNLLSAAVRRTDGRFEVAVGDHEAKWEPLKGNHSTDSQVQVPIWSGKAQWGTVELRFVPLAPGGLLGFLVHPATRLIVFVGSACLLVFYFYLGKMLRHLDPSKVVPARVRAALDTLTEGLLLMDKNEQIVLANRAFAETVGESPDAIQGRRASDLPWQHDKQEDPDVVYPWLDAIEEGEARGGVMLGMRDHVDADRIFMVNSAPVLGEDGSQRGVLASFEDVTELEHTKKAAQAANSAKSDFLARMSHEIRTPMNAILGFTDVLRRGFDEDEQQRQEYLNTIHSSGKYLLELINDILDLSKVESGRMELERTPCSPHKLLSEVATVLRGKANEKDITLDYEFDGLLPEIVVTDPLRLRQTLLNLVGNALKFTDEGGVKMIARLVTKNKRQLLAVDIVDSGIGIPQDKLERIFEPFSQADGSVTRRFGGTGLGLAISRRLARAMGGDLTVTSELGKGSVFTVAVDPGPLDDIQLIDTAAAAEVTQEETQKREEATGKLPSGRILVVDDGIANRKLISLVLGRAGAETVTAENGQQAVELANRESFDVILMDMQMPIMDGYTATRTLRDQGFTVPIIALTAHAMQGDEDKCRAAGCSGFLTKPVDMDQLIKTVSAALSDRGEASDTDTKPSTPTAKSTRADAPLAAPEVNRSVAGPQTESHSQPESSQRPAPSQPEATAPRPHRKPFDAENVFAGFLTDKLRATRDALKTRDFQQLAEIGHDLRGTCGSFGYAQFTQSATALEESAEKQEMKRIAAAVLELTDLADDYFRRPSSQQKQVPMKPTSEAAEVKPVAELVGVNKATPIGPPLQSSLPTDDPEFCEIVVEFIERLHDQLAEMRTAHEDQDFELLAGKAHWLKGSGGTAGFASFTEPAKELEAYAKQQRVDSVDTALSKIEQIAARVVPPTHVASTEVVANDVTASTTKSFDDSPMVSSLPTEDPEFREIVAEFVERLHVQLDQMQRAADSGDLENLAGLAHWLKGSGGTAGFDAFTAPSRELEQHAKQGQMSLIGPQIAYLRELTARIVVEPGIATSIN